MKMEDEDIMRDVNVGDALETNTENLQFGKRLNPRDEALMLFSLHMYVDCPIGYQLLAKTMNLPSIHDLKNYNLNINTDLSDNILTLIENKIKTYGAKAKYCSLCVDLIDLEENLTYDPYEDCIIGYTSVNGEQSRTVASKAIVLMLRGTFSNWKLCVAYGFIPELNVEKTNINNWIDEAIRKLRGRGLEVHSLVTSPNELLRDYANSKEVTSTKPYFQLNDSKIFFFYNVDELQIKLRDLVFNHNVHVQFDDSKTIEVDMKKHVRDLYEIDKKFHLTKLTESHINLNEKTTKIKKYASNVFSHKAAASIEFYVDIKRLPAKAKSTAQFLLLMDRLFDIMHSYKTEDDNKYKEPFSANAEQKEILIKSLSLIDIMYRFHRDDVFKCLQISINALLGLYDDIKDRASRRIMTSRLSLNCVELFKRDLKKKYKKTPVNCFEFRKSFNRLFIDYLFEQKAPEKSQTRLEDIMSKFERFSLYRKSLTESEDEVPRYSKPNDFNFNIPSKYFIEYAACYIISKVSSMHNECADFKLSNLAELSPCLETIRWCVLNDQEIQSVRGMFINKEFLIFLSTMATDACKSLPCLKIGDKLCSVLETFTFRAPCSCFPIEFVKDLFVAILIHEFIRQENSKLMPYIKNVFDEDNTATADPLAIPGSSRLSSKIIMFDDDDDSEGLV